jgi:hypothetical protein
MFFGRTTALGLILGTTLGVVAGSATAYADDVIVPAPFAVAEIQPQEPQPTVAPLPPSRAATFTQRQIRTAAVPARATTTPARVERVAFAEPRRRMEANLVSYPSRPNFMWIGVVY